MREIAQAVRLDPHHLEQLDGAGLCGGFRQPAAPAQDLVHLVSDAVHRIERVHRTLRDKRDVAPAQRIHGAFRQGHQILSGKDHLPAQDAGVVGNHPGQGAGHRGLATAGFADDPDDAARRHVETDPRHGEHIARAHPVGNFEIADGKQRFGHRPSFGKSRFSYPREMKKPALTTRMIASPGGMNQ